MCSKYGFVYLFFDGQFYKIGHTDRNVNVRLNEAQIYNPNEIKLIYSYETLNYKKIEWLFHRRFHSNNIRGEWFDLSPDDIKDFPKLCLEFENLIDAMKENPFF